jgi:hypothetical protein
MPDMPDNASPMDRLCRKGDPRDTWRWHEGDPDYVTEFRLQQTHVPALVEIAREWVENDELPEDEWSAPIHAWRALAQLRAVEVVEPLLAMQNRLDEQGDQWYLEEFHDVFGVIGAPALAALSEYLADRDNEEFPRISTANGLCEIGKRHPETRPQVVEVLASQLGEHEPGVYSLNGFLVLYLTNLNAVESAEVIERAFAAGVVDETVAGDWTIIREELGVPGQGLVPDRPRPPRPHFGFGGSLGQPIPADREGRARQRQMDRKAKVKRKQQKKARKRNRKRR